MTYTAPTTEQLFVLQHIARIDAMAQHDRFAAATPDDQALEHALFTNLGCYYVPAADGRSVRDWLQHVSGRLRARM